MKTLTLLALAASMILSGVGQAATIVTVRFDSGSQFLRDASGSLLSAGTSIEGDGAVLQLGYYTGATTANNFLGTWVPLSGEGSLNTGAISEFSNLSFNETSIGDLNAEAAGDGTFALVVTFTVGDSETGNNLPASTTIPLSIRFFNASTLAASTAFNVVSNDSWKWKTPAENSFDPVEMSLDEANLEWQGGASSAFKTTLPVPEPSTGLALLGGVALLVAHRRRR